MASPALLPPLALLLSFLQEGVVVLALRHILWSITLVGELVEDEAELAALLAGRDTIQTNVELGAIVSVGILRMGVELAELVSGGLFRADEPIGCHVGVSLALCPVGDLWPVAHAAVLVKPEAGGTGVLLGSAIHTSIEDVADAGVRVGVEAVETRTQVAGALRGLELQPVATVHVEVMIARLPLPAEGIKHQAVRAETILWYVIKAVVVFVALHGVGEVAVLLRASEV